MVITQTFAQCVDSTKIRRLTQKFHGRVVEDGLLDTHNQRRMRFDIPDAEVRHFQCEARTLQ